MSRLVVGFVGLVAALALVGSVGSLLLGLAVFVAGLGAEELAKMIGIGLGILMIIFGAVLLAPAMALLHATQALRAAAPGLPATTPRSRVVGGGVALVSGLACLMAAAISETVGQTGTVVTIAWLAGAVFCGTAAWAARYFPQQDLGRGLLVVALLGGGLAGWVSLSMLGVPGYDETPLEPAGEPSDQALNSVSPGDVARDIGSVGTWILIAGGTPPTVPEDASTGPNMVLAELRGKPVRFALVGQCRIDGTYGYLTADLVVVAGASAGEITSRRLALSPLRCNGLFQTSVSVAVDLPAWLDASAPDAKRQAWFSAAVVTSSPSDGRGTPARRVQRWLVYVSPEPPSAVEDVAREAAELFGPLR